MSQPKHTQSEDPSSETAVDSKSSDGEEFDKLGEGISFDDSEGDFDELLSETSVGDPENTAASDSSGGDSGGDKIGDHRGAFGEFGATVERGFLDRGFRERIVLVGVALSSNSTAEVEESLDELELLVDTAGADTVERVIQKRDQYDPATFVGKGKAREVGDISRAHDADTVVFDDELSPGQQYNLEKILKRTALDRTAVILDIFAQNATSAEGKAQVELAQLRYRLPRLRGKKDFSQQAGGIGTRGPGETQLEVDRRRLLRRVHKLERDLTAIGSRRQNQRKARNRSPHRSVSIVGYTNAGKSSVLRRLTGAKVVVEDRLFATLDPTTRKLQLPGGEQIFVTDTVGFVKKLPHQLVEAFKSTLEVAADADLLVHVVDGSASNPMQQIEAVQLVLSEIDAHEIPQLLVFNKADLSPEVERLARKERGAVAVSAGTGAGFEELLDAIAAELRALSRSYEMFIPWSRGDVLAAAHREGEVLSEETTDEGMRLEVLLEAASRKRLAEFVTAEIE